MRFKIDWASLIVRSKFTVFALFYCVFEGNFPSTSPWRPYIWRGELTEVFWRYRIGGGGGWLIFGGAYFQNFTVFIRLFCLFFFGVSCRYMSLANFTGIPGLTLPVGYDDHGLPIALQVMSSWWNEHVLLRVSHAAEGFTPKTKPQVHYNLLE